MELLSVSEAAAACGVSVHTLRYYERAGVLSGVGRDSAGRRQYTQGDLDAIEFVLRLRDTGMPIGDIKRYADLVRAGKGTEDTRLAVLESHRTQLVASIAVQQRHLEQIDRKIGYYREHLGSPGTTTKRNS